ncbi:hypothetical protein Bbelb_095340 [Branchiostoma belcheri]|nr:hypothetical protein Bbelb_095340 [Branchiostoma belcheri]
MSLIALPSLEDMLELYGAPVPMETESDDTMSMIPCPPPPSEGLEQVQRRAARWVSQRFRRTSSVNNMLEELQWIPLRERRRLARLTTFYKYHTGALCINMQTRPTPNVQTRATRQSHSAAYRVPQSRTSYRQNSFFPRTIPDWNTLDADIALSPSLEEFRGKLWEAAESCSFLKSGLKQRVKREQRRRQASLSALHHPAPPRGRMSQPTMQCRQRSTPMWGRQEVQAVARDPFPPWPTLIASLPSNN